MGGTSNIYGTDKKFIQKFRSENQKRRGHSTDLGAYERITLR
jgi:hypothetical protein